MMKNVCVFASGTGSNFEAIYKDSLLNNSPYKVVLLVSDKASSKAVEKANQYGIDSYTFHPKDYQRKELFEQDILTRLIDKKIDLIVLAGYMRLIGPTLLLSYPNRILNIHPSLLPLFKGKDAVGQAMEKKAKETGVTVHFVDEGMDTGRIIKQEQLDISSLYSREEIEREVHKIEHKLYPKVIRKIVEELI